ncbi:heme peroxidase [Peziza echinospora]|nr:heme peroxidase [Peziza echinospora]
MESTITKLLQTLPTKLQPRSLTNSRNASTTSLISIGSGSTLPSIVPTPPSKADTEKVRLRQQILNMGLSLPDNLDTILDLVTQKNGYVDDRAHLPEAAMQFVSALPEDSLIRKRITELMVEKLWTSMLHPPISYVGTKFDYRMPDGSNNSIMYPDLGKAGTPYARSVNPGPVPLEGARPDPGMLFDLLMARKDYKENPAGLSSMLYYHASIITHDLFKTDYKDKAINNTSSYLDLSPLYGTSQATQDSIRTFADGKIKPDTYAEERLQHLPPGVSVMLVMYSRFHNYVVENLAAIDEGGRFARPSDPNNQQAWKKRDEDLFQTGRLITCGLYVNISLHDYIRAIVNMPATATTWTLDPRIEIEKKLFDKVGVPRGVGNQVSCEFNLLYRFHATVSKRDEAYSKKVIEGAFPGQDVDALSMPEFLAGVSKLARNVPADPSQRTFAHLKRGPDGRFNDEELVTILTESVDDPAGAFGALNTPKVLRSVEILGILQSRQWQLASLNEFRKFFDCKPYETFEEIHSDPYITNTLKTLYGHVDNIEMYPGMMIEETKPRMDPGMAICGPYTVTKAILSDAIALIRGDRFATIDYTTSKLTNWGFKEVESDCAILGGARMHQLILNAFPGFFKPNSVYALQPFYTSKRNKEIFDSLGTTHLFDFSRPQKGPKAVPVSGHAGITSVFADTKKFVPVQQISPADLFQLSAEGISNLKSGGALVRAALGNTETRNKNKDQFRQTIEEYTSTALQREKQPLGKDWMIDIVASVGNSVPLYFTSALLGLPLKTEHNPNGSYNSAELFDALCDVNLYFHHNNDETKSFARRRDARAAVSKLHAAICDSLQPSFGLATFSSNWQNRLSGLVDTFRQGFSIVEPVNSTSNGTTTSPLEQWGHAMLKKLLDDGVYEVEELAWHVLVAASDVVTGASREFAQILNLFLQPERRESWKEIISLSASNDDSADELIWRYTLEAKRLTTANSIQRKVVAGDGERVVVKGSLADDGTENGSSSHRSLGAGDIVLLDLATASLDPSVFPDPTKIRLDRPVELYGIGRDETLHHDLITVITASMLKTCAQLKSLRRTPGPTGQLNTIKGPSHAQSIMFMSKSWSELTPYPETLKVIFSDK